MIRHAAWEQVPLFDRAQKDERILLCPRDARPMEKFTQRGVQLDRCTTCGGTWFDAKEIRRVTGDKELERRATRVPLVQEASGFNRPSCRGACSKGHVDEVEVDTCISCHGVWLDAGELAAAVRQARAHRLVASQSAGFRAFLAEL